MFTRTLGTLALGVLLIVATGCGQKYVPLNGVVTLDGTPVAGATVTFVTEDGKSAAGLTDASGNFTLSSAGESGLLPGTYKVVVTKFPNTGEGMNLEAGNQDYTKTMEKMAKEQGKGSMPKTPMPGKGMPMPGKGMPMPGVGVGAAPSTPSELPLPYASATSTPITITVPPPSQPVAIQLKSKP